MYRMAVRHFGLARPHQAVIENAVSYVARTREEQPTGRFQYIVHDVFTGGAEPVDLFTYQFLDGLNELLTEDGVVAIVSAFL